MSRSRAETMAPIGFVSVDPLLSGSDRVRYAVECASFARRADAAVRALHGSVDVVFSEGFATTEADLVRVHSVRLAETEHYFRKVEPRARLRWVRTNIARPQLAVVRAIEQRLFAKRPLCIVPTRRLASQLVDWHGFHPDLVTVVPYGLDTTRFSPDPGARARLRDELGVPPTVSPRSLSARASRGRASNVPFAGWRPAGLSTPSSGSSARTRICRTSSASPANAVFAIGFASSVSDLSPSCRDGMQLRTYSSCRVSRTRRR